MTQQQRLDLDADIRSHPLDLNKPLPQLRSEFDVAMAVPPPAGVRTTEQQLGGVPGLRLDSETSTGQKALLYLHGGGYVAGSARTGVRLAAALATRSGASAFVADYRLAPEHPFPAALTDSLAVYRGMLADHPAEQIVIAGDSAGGGLSIATLLAARDAGLALPAAVVVFSPWIDLTVSGESYRRKASVDPLFSDEHVRWFAEHYVPAEDRANPLVSPAFADLTGLPPLLIQVGSHEVLLDDAVQLARAAAGADVETTLEVVAGVPHVFQNSLGALDEADDALDRAGRFLAERWG